MENGLFMHVVSHYEASLFPFSARRKKTSDVILIFFTCVEIIINRIPSFIWFNRENLHHIFSLRETGPALRLNVNCARWISTASFMFWLTASLLSQPCVCVCVCASPNTCDKPSNIMLDLCDHWTFVSGRTEGPCRVSRKRFSFNLSWARL